MNKEKPALFQEKRGLFQEKPLYKFYGIRENRKAEGDVKTSVFMRGET